MNWIQVYYACLLVFTTIIAMLEHGELKTGRHDFRTDFTALLLHMPMAGRIFGWW